MRHLIDHRERLRSVETLEYGRTVIAHADGRGLRQQRERTHTRERRETLVRKAAVYGRMAPVQARSRRSGSVDLHLALIIELLHCLPLRARHRAAASDLRARARYKAGERRKVQDDEVDTIEAQLCEVRLQVGLCVLVTGQRVARRVLDWVGAAGDLGLHKDLTAIHFTEGPPHALLVPICGAKHNGVSGDEARAESLVRDSMAAQSSAVSTIVKPAFSAALMEAYASSTLYWYTPAARTGIFTPLRSVTVGTLAAAAPVSDTTQTTRNIWFLICRRS